MSKKKCSGASHRDPSTVTWDDGDSDVCPMCYSSERLEEFTESLNRIYALLDPESDSTASWRARRLLAFQITEKIDGLDGTHYQEEFAADEEAARSMGTAIRSGIAWRLQGIQSDIKKLLDGLNAETRAALEDE